jgi:hypothetical protein
MGWTAWVQSPAGARDFSLLHSEHTGCGAHPASYAVDVRGSFLGVKRPVREADNSPPSAAEVKDGGAIPPLPHMSQGQIYLLIDGGEGSASRLKFTIHMFNTLMDPWNKLTKIDYAKQK